jgi:hypothetical protein
MIFLQSYLRIADKIFDLDDDRVPNLAEHQKKTSPLGSLFLDINYNIFYDRTISYKRYQDKTVHELTTTTVFPSR